MKGSEIQNLVFSVSLFGYKKSDIRACLREISEYVLKLESKIYELELERDKLKDKINKVEISQSNFKDIITSAQEFRKRIELEAEEKAMSIIKKARDEYDEVIKSIKGEKTKLEIIKKDVLMVKKTILEKLDNFVNLVDLKEKNIKINEDGLYKNNLEFSKNKNFFSSEEKNSKKEILSDKTMEFPTKSKENSRENLKFENDDVKEYIKGRFKEIDSR